MLHRAAHLIPVMRYSQKFLTNVIPVIRYVAWSNTSCFIYEVWSEAAGICYVLHRETHYSLNNVCSGVSNMCYACQ